MQKNRRYGEITSNIIDIYKNDVMLHGNHMHTTEKDMSMETILTFT